MFKQFNRYKIDSNNQRLLELQKRTFREQRKLQESHEVKKVKRSYSMCLVRRAVLEKYDSLYKRPEEHSRFSGSEFSYFRLATRKSFYFPSYLR